MIESLYGSNDIKVIESKLADIEFKVLQDSYVKAVYNNIRLFPTHLGNVMEASPYLYYDEYLELLYHIQSF